MRAAKASESTTVASQSTSDFGQQHQRSHREYGRHHHHRETDEHGADVLRHLGPKKHHLLPREVASLAQRLADEALDALVRAYSGMGTSLRRGRGPSGFRSIRGGEDREELSCAAYSWRSPSAELLMNRAARKPTAMVTAATAAGRRRTTSSTSLKMSAKLRSRMLSASWSSPSAALSTKARIFGRSSKELVDSRSDRRQVRHRLGDVVLAAIHVDRRLLASRHRGNDAHARPLRRPSRRHRP